MRATFPGSLFSFASDPYPVRSTHLTDNLRSKERSVGVLRSRGLSPEQIRDIKGATLIILSSQNSKIFVKHEDTKIGLIVT